MAILNLFIPKPASTVVHRDITSHSTPLAIQRLLDTCEDILIIGAPCFKEWRKLKPHRGKIDHIDTHWLRNYELNNEIKQALKHSHYDAVVCCREPLAPWMDLTEREANDAASLITASGYTLPLPPTHYLES